MRWLGVPQASIPSISSSRLVSGSTRPGTAGPALRPEPEAAPSPSSTCTSRARQLSGTPWGGGPFCLGGEQPFEQGTAAWVGR
jgi:hypothetical protein